MSHYDNVRAEIVAIAAAEAVAETKNTPLVPFGEHITQPADIAVDATFKQIVAGSVEVGHWTVTNAADPATLHPSAEEQSLPQHGSPGHDHIADILVSHANLQDFDQWRPSVNIGVGNAGGTPPTDQRSARGTGWWPAAIFRVFVRGLAKWFNDHIRPYQMLPVPIYVRVQGVPPAPVVTWDPLGVSGGCARLALGRYIVAYAATFADNDAVMVSVRDNSGIPVCAVLETVTDNGVSVRFWDPMGGAPMDPDHGFAITRYRNPYPAD